MAAPPTPSATRGQPAGCLRVRLGGDGAWYAEREWALEALLARAGVRDWELVVDGAADLALPHDPTQWEFDARRAPDPDRDPLAAAFWWLARVEELLAPEDAFDEHGRFRYEASALAAAGDPLARPVDEIAAGLRAAVGAWVVDPAPAGEPGFRVVATHDIDLPWRWTRIGRRRALRALRDDLRRGALGGVARALGALAALPVWRLIGRDPWCNAARIARLERRCGATSTSYLLAGCHAPEDGAAELHERGFEPYGRAVVGDGTGTGAVGVHGSYTVRDVPERLREERARVERLVGRAVTDHRFHYLRHRPVEAWPQLAAAGFASDASLGYAERVGFRAGTAHPFRAWDHAAGRPLDLVVVPLALMDASFDARYAAALDAADPLADPDHAQAAVVDAIRDARGAASVLVHNDRLCNVASAGWTRRYRALLERVRAQGGVVCTAADAAAAYRALLPAHRRRP